MQILDLTFLFRIQRSFNNRTKLPAKYVRTTFSLITEQKFSLHTKSTTCPFNEKERNERFTSQ